MQTKKLLGALLCLLVTSFSSCELLGEKEEESGKCFTGSWKRSICGGSYTAYLTLNGSGSSGTGSLSDRDCNLGWTRTFRFNWTDNGNGTLRLTYTYFAINGQEGTLPTGGNQAYNCSGSSLTFGNTYTKN
ncbi:MAG: hypothetical protein J0L83_10410 [Chitinophagales bacterium]|jgi:hypothetical protein|nr:hypothetical protein [Chitinophagales bacterium]